MSTADFAVQSAPVPLLPLSASLTSPVSFSTAFFHLLLHTRAALSWEGQRQKLPSRRALLSPVSGGSTFLETWTSCEHLSSVAPSFLCLRFHILSYCSVWCPLPHPSKFICISLVQGSIMRGCHISHRRESRSQQDPRKWKGTP